MNIDAINAALIAVGPAVAIGGVTGVATWLVHLGDMPAPAAPAKREPQGAIQATASVARPLPSPVVEGEILPAAAARKELTR